MSSVAHAAAPGQRRVAPSSPYLQNSYLMLSNVNIGVHIIAHRHTCSKRQQANVHKHAVKTYEAYQDHSGHLELSWPSYSQAS